MPRGSGLPPGHGPVRIARPLGARAPDLGQPRPDRSPGGPDRGGGVPRAAPFPRSPAGLSSWKPAAGRGRGGRDRHGAGCPGRRTSSSPGPPGPCADPHPVRGDLHGGPGAARPEARSGHRAPDRFGRTAGAASVDRRALHPLGGRGGERDRRAVRPPRGGAGRAPVRKRRGRDPGPLVHLDVRHGRGAQARRPCCDPGRARLGGEMARARPQMYTHRTVR